MVSHTGDEPIRHDTTAPPIDPELLARARAGDTEAQHELYTRFTPLLRRVSAPYREDPELREELPGELYLLFQHLVEEYEAGRGVQFTTYITRSLDRHVWSVVRRHRRHARRTPLGPPPDPAGEGSEERAASGPSAPTEPQMWGIEKVIMMRLLLEAALARLDRRSRVICRMRLAGYDYGEIARRVGLREAACRQAFRRARAALREALGGEEERG